MPITMPNIEANYAKPNEVKNTQRSVSRKTQVETNTRKNHFLEKQRRGSQAMVIENQSSESFRETSSKDVRPPNKYRAAMRLRKGLCVSPYLNFL